MVSKAERDALRQREQLEVELPDSNKACQFCSRNSADIMRLKQALYKAIDTSLDMYEAVDALTDRIEVLEKDKTRRDIYIALATMLVTVCGTLVITHLPTIIGALVKMKGG